MNGLPGNLADIFDRITDAFVTLDRNLCYTCMNKKAGEILNCDPEKMMGKHFSADSSEIFFKNLKKFYEQGLSGEVVIKEISVPQAQGSGFLWFELKVEPILDEDKIIGIVSIMRNITEQKKAEAVIRKEKELSDSIINSLPGIFYMSDLTPRLLRWNKALETYSGYSAEELEKIVPITLFDPEDRTKLRQAMEKVYKEGSGNVEVQLLTRNGEKIPFYFTGVSIEYEGRPVMLGKGIDISERRKADTELRKSIERFELLAETTKDGLWEWNLETNELWANKMHQHLYGLTPADPVPAEKEWEQRIHPDDRERIMNLKKEIHASTKNLWDSEYRFKSGDKGYIVIYDRSYIVRNEEGLPARIMGSMTDVTKNKEVEKELVRANERFKLINEAANDALWEWNLETNGIWVNEIHMKMYGLTVHDPEPVNIGWKSRLDPDDHDRIIKLFADAIHSEVRSFESEFRLYTENKGWVNMFGRTYIERNADGKAIRMLGSIIDITKQKNTEKDLLSAKQLSESVINSLPGIFYLFNTQGQFLLWNKNLESVSKYNPAEIRRMHPTDFFSGDEKELVIQKIENVFRTGADNLLADFTIKTGKKIPYYFNGISTEYEGQSCLMGVGIDFSELIKAQEKIKETTVRLRQLTAHLQNIREEERKRIGREIHDDLGQQLTAIKMNVAWIDKKLKEVEPVVKEKLKNIIGLLDQSNLSVRRILSELRPSILDDNSLLDAMRWHGKEFSTHTGIPLEIRSSESEIRLPEEIATCIYRVFQESLTNVARYAKAKNVLVTITRNDHTVSVMIEDNGEGFDQDLSRVKKTFGILGMKERVRSLNGEFEINSGLGNGTKISFSLPVEEGNKMNENEKL